MQKLTSILVVASRTSTDQMLLEKAVALARCVGAQIHLLSCDVERARLLRHSYPMDEAERAWIISLAENLTYLRRLQAAVFAPDVRVTVDAICHSPLYEGVAEKIWELRPDLVMKAPAAEHPLRRVHFDSNDWKLTKVCPTSLMLVRPRRWATQPKFAALVDLAEEETARFAQTLVHASEYFALGCQGELDIIYSEGSTDEREKGERLDRLSSLVREYHIQPGHVRLLSGAPDEVVPEFAAGQNYDAVVLGARTHRKGVATARELLTSRIADRVACDLILVPHREYDPQLSKVTQTECSTVEMPSD
jgi:nucleotide-binding universal stress UspA family protein